MRTRLALSWLFLLAGGAYGAHLSYAGAVEEDPLVAALSYGYAVWGLYWCVPVVLRWWSRLDFGAELVPRLVKLLVGCVVVPTLGYLLGVLGGGIYQFLKAWWQTRA